MSASVSSLLHLFGHRGDVRRHTYLTVRRWTLALAILLFPALFILDTHLDSALSPILPGLAVLLLLWLVAPIVVWEVLHRTNRMANPDKMEGQQKWSRGAVIVALLVFLLWLALGA